MLLISAALVFHLELVRQSLTGTHYRYRDAHGMEINESVPARHSEAPRSLRSGQAPSARNLGGRPARVFAANPVETLNDPSLQDRNNSAGAVPDAAYSTVELDDVNPSGPLGGPYVQITDLQPPAVAPIDSSQSLLLDRSSSGFEDVNAYFQIDRSQRYLQSLGYRGGRTIAPYPVPVDTHALNGEDNSLFIPAPETGHVALVLGDGGTDDAEDPDLVLHEYAHAIHEWIAPGTFLGSFNSQARAISEGFADYWAFSASYETSVRSGRDPFCLADWDARCAEDASSERCGYPAGADCLRRLDSPKTIADFNTNDASGTEYLNAVIWSSALREIFVALTQRYGIETGKRTADTIVVESLFGTQPNPGFATIARNMIAVDRYLNAGANADLICAAMTHRGILGDCATVPRGEWTFFESSERGVPIPDNDATGVTLHTFVSDARPIERLFVRTDIDHAFRGDLRIVLIAPGGSEFVLQTPSPDRATNIRTTFGRDAIPVDSLEPLRGRSAQGDWRLFVADLRPRDAGTVLSWGLVIQFAGDEPALVRPSNQIRQTIPVAGRIPGANGTFFTTDVRLLNRGTRDVKATMIFTPSGVDGRSQFAAVNVNVAAGQVVALNDVVGTWFGSTGIGQLEIDGDVIATSRTNTRGANGGTYGETISPVRDRTGRSSAPLQVIGIRNNADYRTNVGLAEISGAAGRVEITYYSSAKIVADETYVVAPFGHIQFASTADSAIAVIRVLEGDAEVAAYASVVDNSSGDAAYVAGETAERVRGVFAPAIQDAGARNTSWSTDVQAAGFGNSVALFYTARGASAPAAFSFPLFPNTLIVWPDIVRSQFGSPNSAGVLRAVLQPGSLMTVTIRTDSFAQSVALLEASNATVLDIPHVENSSAFRTNVGLMSGTDTIANVSLLDATGKTLETRQHAIAANQLDQFPIGIPMTNGRVHIEVLSGRLAAYASVVDNVTGDASFVPAD